MTRFLLVALGGGLGAAARYGLGLAAGRMVPGAAWPWGTFACNVLGGLVMGLLVGWLALRGGAGQDSVRLFAAVGVLGGFTTFSSFSLEAVLLMERRQIGLAGAYIALSVVLAVGALMIGLWLGRRAFA